MTGVVVIGASSGGPAALRALISELPEDFPLPILIVLHIGPRPSVLPSILNDRGRLKAGHATEGEIVVPGRVYIAPPDHHLVLVDGKLTLDHGPRENWTRPAIDPLFRSAAEAYGQDAIGILLTGELNDGTAGLFEIKKAGGTVIVQNPEDAESPSMPRSALKTVAVDYCLPLSQIPEALVRVATEESRPKRGREEQGVSAMKHHKDHQDEFGRPVAQTCPECGGAMSEQAKGKLTQFRCHIGHLMTAEVLAVAQREALEQHFASALRTLNERVELCRDMTEKCSLIGNPNGAERWSVTGKEAAGRIDLVRELVEAEWTHPDGC